MPKTLARPVEATVEEQAYVYACWMYYREFDSPWSDAKYDALVLRLMQKRPGWSQWLVARLPDAPEKTDLATAGHALAYHRMDGINACAWAEKQ